MMKSVKTKDVSEHTTINYRLAVTVDIPHLIRLLADDSLGETREITGKSGEFLYLEAFDKMHQQKDNEYLLATGEDEQILGCVQITLIAGLSRAGMSRALLEGVRVAAEARGSGIGSTLIKKAIEIARTNGCGLVQLTTDRHRDDALMFYTSLGFEETHHGLKLAL